MSYHSKQPSARIAIIGAGISGLTCARTLFDNDWEDAKVADPQPPVKNSTDARTSASDIVAYYLDDISNHRLLTSAVE